MPIITITLRGISGSSSKFAINNNKTTADLYNRVWEGIDGDNTGRELDDLILLTPQKRLNRHQHPEHRLDILRQFIEQREGYPSLKEGENEGKQGVSIPNSGSQISIYLEGPTNDVYYVFKPTPQVAAAIQEGEEQERRVGEQAAVEEAARAGARAQLKTSKRRRKKSKKRKSKRRRSKTRRRSR